MTAPAWLNDDAERSRLVALTAFELRSLPDGHPDREAWHETVEWAETLDVETMVQYLGSIRTKSIGELLTEVAWASTP